MLDAERRLPISGRVVSIPGTLAVAFASLGFWAGVAAIVLGNVISAALVGALAVMGLRTGLAQISASRLPFGNRYRWSEAVVHPERANSHSAVCVDVKMSSGVIRAHIG